MTQKPVAKMIASLLMLALAAYFGWSFWKNNRNNEPKTYFYDLSERKLFTASQNAVPPITGLDGKVADAVRAIVYSPSGDCEREKKIAYLEKYSPELKAQFEAAQENPTADIPRMSRQMAQSHTFVCRVNETNWFPMDSEEAGNVLGEWRVADPEGKAIICVP